jgi:YhcH/YjgK/YiaL family protein
MILDDLQFAMQYYPLHPGFRAAFECLQQTKLRDLPLGRRPLDGDRLFLLLARDPGRGRQGAKLEAHRKYIDIQLSLGGLEEIGWKPTSQCAQVVAPYDADRDIMFFQDKSDAWIALPPGKFMVLWPGDAHAPLAGQGELYKAVVKVAVDW